MAGTLESTMRVWTPLRNAMLEPGEARGDLLLGLGLAVVQVAGSIGASQGQPERDPVDALAVMLLLTEPAA
jgi:hypothetical protein